MSDIEDYTVAETEHDEIPIPDGMFAVADMLADVRDEKERLAKLLKTANETIARCEAKLNELMLEDEMPRFSRRGRTFFVTTKRYVRASPERRDDLYQWLRSNGYESIVQETINANTLRATVNEIITEQGEMPRALEDLVIVDEVPAIGVRRGA